VVERLRRFLDSAPPDVADSVSAVAVVDFAMFNLPRGLSPASRANETNAPAWLAIDRLQL
jgi:hypothetical protein